MYIKIDSNNVVLISYDDSFVKDSTGLIHVEGGIPDFELEGKRHVIKYDAKSNTVYPEYENLPLTELQLLKFENQQLREQVYRVTETLDMVLIDLIPSLLGGGETE